MVVTCKRRFIKQNVCKFKAKNNIFSLEQAYFFGAGLFLRSRPGLRSRPVSTEQDCFHAVQAYFDEERAC